MNKHISNFRKIIIIGILTLLFGSCSDFLDKNPLDQISSQTFWTSDNEVQMALAGVYSRLYVATFNHDDAKTDVMAGESSANQSQAWVPIAQGGITSTAGSIINEIYSNCYLGIGSCNFFLANVDKAKAVVSDANLNKYKAEVMFLRALFYNELVDAYGGVPLYTKPVTIDEAKVKQSTKEQVVTQILSDLDFAIANLPNVAYTDGHAVKGSALALKARVLLYNSRWAEAAATAKQVMDLGKFTIFNNYRTLFLAIGQTNNTEIIFSTRYLNPDQAGDLDIRWNWHGVVNPRKELVDDYECKDGLPITSSPLYNPAKIYENRDPRLAMTIKDFSESAVLNSSGKLVTFMYNGQSASGFNPVKYGNWDALTCDYSTKSEQDWILIRYADVLLMYAEATNEATGPNQSVYDALNAIRARPGVAMPAIATGKTQAQLRDIIRHERRIELAMEGQRWSDIKRWKTAETYINTLVDQGGTKRKFIAPTHYLLPFPQSEIDVNKNLVQNPGY